MGLNEKEIETLHEIGLSHIAALLTTPTTGRLGAKVPGLLSRAKSCDHNNGKARCKLSINEIAIDRNWECSSYARKGK